MPYSLNDFDYNLPLELIAQEQAKPRDHSRLLLLDKKTGEINHRHFFDIVDYLRKGDLLVLNNSKVFPARLIGHKKETGGEVEIFLHHKDSNNIWECLLGGRVKEGLVISFSNQLEAELMKNNNDGTWQVTFNISGENFWRTINKIGEVPLPPYIKRNKQVLADKKNYQTVFASDAKVGSVAAPTAGLHLTKKLLKKIQAKGVKIAYLTLHVGLGTFAPVKEAKINDHKMHSEFMEVKKKTLKALKETKESGGRIVAVGTTSCRSLESLDWEAIKSDRHLKDQCFWTDIFIFPGYKFKLTDALITNFHLPKSTLLMLVSALSSQSFIKRAYRAAISEKYRFFSYGDSMFIY